jgi:two-component system sensor histidine kinase UhpB
MNNPNALRNGKADYLSVIHKAPEFGNTPPHHHLVLQTDPEFIITGWNSLTEEFNDRPLTIGQNFFKAFDVKVLNGSYEEVLLSLGKNGFWSGETILNTNGGQHRCFNSTITYILDKKQDPISAIIVNHPINSKGKIEYELETGNKKYDSFLNTISNGVVMVGADGKIVTCNRTATEIFGLAENELVGRLAASPSWKAVKVDGSVFPIEQFPAMVSLQTGFPQRDVIMGVEQANGNLVWLSVNSDALIKPGEFDPYAAIVSFSDITNFIAADKELQKNNERFNYVAKITSDAIWDFDVVTNEIYRSETFSRISGHSKEDISSSLNWWFDRVHPEDQARVKFKLEEQLRLGNERWQDEYRFVYADGSYKTLHDSGIILYKDGKPARMLGAIRDITEEIKLKQQLSDEQTQKQKAITKATIKAQEDEKAKISRELHDNVNQIIMSAKLYMETARQTPENAEKMLDKAIEYQLLALHEIRKLSKSLNTTAITAAGLKESIGDIVQNLEMLQSISVRLDIDNAVEKRLNENEKLTVYRIVQEQTNNIIKYAEATEVIIKLKKIDGKAELTISDNGKGFDINKQKGFTGIGFINMNSRAIALDGSLDINSSPGNGCVVKFTFPIN